MELDELREEVDDLDNIRKAIKVIELERKSRADKSRNTRKQNIRAEINERKAAFTKTITDTPDPEQKKQLIRNYVNENTRGYFIVPPEKYDALDVQNKIMYINADGSFKKGGYIWSKNISKAGQQYWIIGFTKTPNFKANYYILYWNKVRILWKKMNYESELLRLSVDDKHNLIKDISTFLSMKFGNEFIEFMNKQELTRLRKPASVKSAPASTKNSTRSRR